MSLINQVLNDLEQRGTGVAQTGAVRAVPSSGRQGRNPVIWLLAVMLLAVVLAAMWWKMQQHAAVASQVQNKHIPKPAAAIRKPALPPPLPFPATPEKVMAEPATPSLNLSFELSSIPLPSSEAQHRPAERPHKVSEKPHVAAATKQPVTVSAQKETQEGYGGPPIKQISPQQQAGDEYGQALALIQQGRKSEALPHLETALQLDPGQTAVRRALVGLLLESRRNAEAERLLQEGLRHDPGQSDLAMLLARLQVERGAMQQALQTLEAGMPFADQRADYHAFLAAVLQRLKRNKEAITHYQIALHLNPASAVWWMGLGISFEAVDDDEDARNAFKRAADMHKLKPQLQAFVEQRLKVLQPAK